MKSRQRCIILIVSVAICHIGKWIATIKVNIKKYLLQYCITIRQNKDPVALQTIDTLQRSQKWQAKDMVIVVL